MPTTLSLKDVPSTKRLSQVDPRRWLMLAVLLLATFMGSLDMFIVNVAVPSIEIDLHASFAAIQLVIAGYTLAYAVVLATGGRLGDLYGCKRFFLLGVAGFTLFSFLCGLAPNVIWLVIFRVLQGGTAALMLPQVISLINISFLPEERGKAFGSYVAIMGLAASLGQIIGGVLLAANVWGLGWRSIFLVNIPIGVITLVAAWFLVHESRVSTARRLDMGGVVLLTVALFLFIYPLTEASSTGWSLWSILSLIAAGVLFVAFLRYEQWLTRRGLAPLVPLSLFESRAFVAGSLSTFLIQALFAALLLMLAFYLQDGLKYLPWQSGLVVMVSGIAYMLASSVSATITRKFGQLVLSLGAALVTLGYLVTLLAAWIFVPCYGISPLLVGLFLISCGNGMLAPLLINKALSEIDSSIAGAASGGVYNYLTGRQCAWYCVDWHSLRDTPR